jgi:hypothetical protein
MPLAGKSGILLHRNGKLTIAKLKSSRLSYNLVVSVSLESILSKLSNYEGGSSRKANFPKFSISPYCICDILTAN